MTTKRCGCGNDDVLPGYRVCAECKEAREIYPHIFEGDEPDKLPNDAEDTAEMNEDYPPALSPVQQALHWARNNGGIMPAHTLKAAVLQLCAENERLKGYAAFCYSCAKCSEQPMTYEEYLARLNRDGK